MKPIVLVLGVLLLIVLIACRGEEESKTAKAQLKNAQGEQVGSATLTETNGGINVSVQVSKLPAGFHGFHVHTTGKCAPDFAAAGGHLNPSGKDHPSHAADLPVLLVNTDGKGEASFKTDRFTMAELLDTDGSALIIHANPDNYANIASRYGAPDADTLKTGDAGARIACGVVK